MGFSPPSFWTPRHASELRSIARRAGAAILAHAGAPADGLVQKSDGSPVTAADRESQSLIIAGLAALTPDIPVIAEEKDNPAALLATGTGWMVDPLDGTRDFLAGGRMEYAVSIGLLIDMQPCLGVIYAPALDELFYGDPGGVLRQTPTGEITFRPGGGAKIAGPPRLLTSRHEVSRLPLEAWRDKGLISSFMPCTSSYKFGLLAAGEAELYPRAGPTSEWDTAAGDAMLRAMGGRVITLDGKPLAYGKPGYCNGDFVAFGPSFDAARITDFLGLMQKGKT